VLSHVFVVVPRQTLVVNVGGCVYIILFKYVKYVINFGC
jgi:hypothetical protein